MKKKEFAFALTHPNIGNGCPNTGKTKIFRIKAYLHEEAATIITKKNPRCSNIWCRANYS